MPTSIEQTEILEGLTSYWSDRTHSYSSQNLEEMNDWRRSAARSGISPFLRSAG